MRKPKPNGSKRPHGSTCGICAKPRRYKHEQRLKEIKLQLKRVRDTRAA